MPTVEDTLEVRFKEPIPEIDLCFTDIQLPEFPRTLLQGPGRAMKFSDFISSQEFKNIRERAKKIYSILNTHGVYCPIIVQENPGAITFRYIAEPKILYIQVIPDTPLAYVRGTLQEILTYNFCGSDEELYANLKWLALSLVPKKLRRHDGC